MGAWGGGLYSCDYALDLKPVAAGIARSATDLVAAIDDLVASTPEALDTNSEDHTIFWLVLADQLQKAGRLHEPTFRRARAIVLDGADQRMMAALDMAPAMLKRRARSLSELIDRLNTVIADAPPRARRQQPFLFRPGDVLTYPVMGHLARNPYFPASKHPASWKADGWGAAVVLVCERALDGRCWYGALNSVDFQATRPTLTEACAMNVAYVWSTGACTRQAAARMQIEVLGAISIHSSHLDDLDALLRHGAQMAMGGEILSFSYRHTAPRRTIQSLSEPE